MLRRKEYSPWGSRRYLQVRFCLYKKATNMLITTVTEGLYHIVYINITSYSIHYIINYYIILFIHCIILFTYCIIIFAGMFLSAFWVSYLASPRFCHRFVGYLEEEAVKTYTHCLEVSMTVYR